MAGTWLKRKPNVIKTKSRFKAWWMTTFRGYKNTETVRTPKHGSFGRVAYDCTFFLSPKTRK